MDYNVITIGSATQDVFLKSQDFSVLQSEYFKTGRAECVPLGAKIEVQDIVFTTGGGATNNAVSFARKGLQAACLAAVGTDEIGRAIENALEQEGVVSRFLQKVKGKKSGYSLILVTATGDRSILVYRGASEDLNETAVPWDSLKTDWFYVSSVAGNFNLLEKVAELARTQKVCLAINPGSREIRAGAAKLRPILRQAKVLFLNQEEASYLTGVEFDDLSGITKELYELAGETIFVITRGAKGVLVGHKDRLYKAGIIPEREKVDRTGAGDAFGSGFVASLIVHSKLGLEQGIKEAIRWGSANATSVLEHMGAKKGLLTKRQLSHKRWQGLEIKEQ